MKHSVVKSEVVITESNKGKTYCGEGNFEGDVVVMLTYSNGKEEQRTITGEHSENDIKVNYNNQSNWN